MTTNKVYGLMPQLEFPVGAVAHGDQPTEVQ